MKVDLAEVLRYENQAIVVHFCHQYPEFSLEEGQMLFTDLLAWLWLNTQRATQNKKTYLFGPLLTLDKIWHVFILHTRDYVDFSIRFFGLYFHHDVEPPGFEHVVEEEELADYLEDCFTYLGSAWVERRFEAALYQ